MAFSETQRHESCECGRHGAENWPDSGGGKKKGDFVLATDQITSPHFSSDSKKNNPGFVSSCHVNPSDPRTPVRTKTDGAAKTGTTGSAAPRGLLQTPTTDLTLNPA